MLEIIPEYIIMKFARWWNIFLSILQYMETLNQIEYVHIEHVISPYLIIKLYKWEVHGMMKTEFLVYLYVRND